MADVLIKSESMTNIANAIREKLNTSDTYLPSEMPDAILSIEGGGGGSASADIEANIWRYKKQGGSTQYPSQIWWYSDQIVFDAQAADSYAMFYTTELDFDRIEKITIDYRPTLSGGSAGEGEVTIGIGDDSYDNFDTVIKYTNTFDATTQREVIEFNASNIKGNKRLKFMIHHIPSGYAAQIRLYKCTIKLAVAGGETPEITNITFSEDYSALATTVDGDIREITPTIVDGVITEIDVDGSKVTVEYDEDGYLTKVGSVDIDIPEDLDGRLYLIDSERGINVANFTCYNYRSNDLKIGNYYSDISAPIINNERGIILVNSSSTSRVRSYFSKKLTDLSQYKKIHVEGYGVFSGDTDKWSCMRINLADQLIDGFSTGNMWYLVSESVMGSPALGISDNFSFDLPIKKPLDTDFYIVIEMLRSQDGSMLYGGITKLWLEK